MLWEDVKEGIALAEWPCILSTNISRASSFYSLAVAKLLQSSLSHAKSTMKENVVLYLNDCTRMGLFKWIPDGGNLNICTVGHSKQLDFCAWRRSRVGYRQMYPRMLENIIEKGDVEGVSDPGEEGNTWYIPHHDVYHNQEEKICVVFDHLPHSREW